MMYDLAVIGAGPGGYVAAIRGAQLGARVCLIEGREVGGTCLNRGCIPTKAIISSAELYHKMKKAEEFGLSAGEVGFNLKKIMERKDKIVTDLRTGVIKLLKGNKITLIEGRGKLAGKNEIEIFGENPQSVSAENIILATGSEPLVPGMFNTGSKRVMTSDDAFNLTEIPRSIIIAGGGVLGCEWAIIFNAFGSSVTIIEMLPAIIPTEDLQISRMLQGFLQKKGIKIMTKSRILEIKEAGNEIEALLEGGKSVRAKKLLLSLGRKLNTRGNGFEEAGLEFDGEKIKVDESLRTSIPGIFAIGDITGKKLLAHVASAQGIVAAENALGRDKKMIDYDLIPGCIYTSPQVASVGLTEEKAKEKGIKYIKSRFPFAANGKANCMGETEGFVKIIAGEEDHKILGVHIMGPKATELISEGALALTHGLTAKDVLKTVHPHPTLSEGIMESFAQIEKECIHFL